MKNWLIIPILFMVFGCQKNPEITEVDPDLDLLLKGVEVLDSVRLIYSDSARVRVIVTGPRMHRSQVKRYDQDEFVDGVFAEFYDRNLNLEATLRAGYALRREKDEQIFVRDHVVMVNADGEQLETSELIWKEKERKITTEKAYRIIRKDGTVITGYGFTANESFTTFESHSVQSRMKMKQKP